MSDPYEALGEFHDLFMEESWARLRPVLVDAFSGLGSSELVVDLGAGTGIGTRLLAGCTAARITAVEPSLTMRAVLTARIADDPAMAGRVSVVAGSAPGALDEIRGPVAAFVCTHVLGHVPGAVRAATFQRLAGLLGPGGRGIVTVDPDGGPQDAELVQERRIGDYRYVARYLPSSDPSGYVSEYSVLDGDRVVRQERFVGTWEPLPLDKLMAELASAGLTASGIAPGVALVRRADGAASPLEPPGPVPPGIRQP